MEFSVVTSLYSLSNLYLLDCSVWKLTGMDASVSLRAAAKASKLLRLLVLNDQGSMVAFSDIADRCALSQAFKIICEPMIEPLAVPSTNNLELACVSALRSLLHTLISWPRCHSLIGCDAIALLYESLKDYTTITPLHLAPHGVLLGSDVCSESVVYH